MWAEVTQSSSTSDQMLGLTVEKSLKPVSVMTIPHWFFGYEFQRQLVFNTTVFKINCLMGQVVMYTKIHFLPLLTSFTLDIVCKNIVEYDIK